MDQKRLDIYKFCNYFYDVRFFCIDIVGSSKDTEIQNYNIKNLLIVIKDFLSSYEKQIQTVFTGDGVTIWFKEDSLLPLQVALKIHKEFPQIKEEPCLGLKIGIARGDAIEIDTAKSLVGYLIREIGRQQ